jgi:tetratricopeptide (TPR) repeat protein
MPLSLYALDQFVSQELSQITECHMAGVADMFPEYRSWLTNFVLNTTLRLSLPTKKRALAFAVIRRSEAAIRDYEEARELLTRLGDSRKTVSLYFQCLGRFESTIAMVSQAFEFIRKALGISLYEKGSGTAYERLSLIYNKSRHEDPEKLPTGHLHAVWIKNDGLFADETHLTFAELGDLVCEVGRIADKLSEGCWPD